MKKNHQAKLNFLFDKLIAKFGLKKCEKVAIYVIILDMIFSVACGLVSLFFTFQNPVDHIYYKYAMCAGAAFAVFFLFPFLDYCRVLFKE